jgi:DNA-binding transcriptional MerR regulator
MSGRTGSAERSGAAADLTIDELASRVGLTVRSVRFYAGKRLLPPPRLEGRTGYYGPQHVARLTLVRDLQQAGYTLSAIEQFFSTLDDDADALAIEMYGALLVPPLAGEVMTLTHEELADRLHRPVTEELLELLQAGKVLTVRGEGTVALTQTQLEFAQRVLELQVPLDVLVEGARIVSRHTEQMAEDLQRLFRRRILAQFDASRPEDREQVRAIAANIRPMTIHSMVNAYQVALERAIRAG